jgi:hypothetical protein
MLTKYGQTVVYFKEDLLAFKSLKNADMLPNYFKQRNTNFRKSTEELESQ